MIQELNGKHVHAYRNLHIPGRYWSIREVGSTKIGWRLPEILLFEVDLRVQPAGRKRAVDSKIRNVHAYISGTVAVEEPTDSKWIPATYRPFDGCGSFQLLTGEPISHCKWAWLNSKGLFVILDRP